MRNAKKYSEFISDFLNFINSTENSYKLNLEELSNQEKVTQDILHKLELDNPNSSERSKLATRLSRNRKDRRYYKDRTEEQAPICTFINNNRKAINELTQLLGEVRKQEKYHSSRTYYPRVLKKEQEPIGERR